MLRPRPEFNEQIYVNNNNITIYHVGISMALWDKTHKTQVASNKIMIITINYNINAGCLIPTSILP